MDACMHGWMGRSKDGEIARKSKVGKSSVDRTRDGPSLQATLKRSFANGCELVVLLPHGRPGSPKWKPKSLWLRHGRPFG